MRRFAVGVYFRCFVARTSARMYEVCAGSNSCVTQQWECRSSYFFEIVFGSRFGTAVSSEVDPALQLVDSAVRWRLTTRDAGRY